MVSLKEATNLTNFQRVLLEKKNKLLVGKLVRWARDSHAIYECLPNGEISHDPSLSRYLRENEVVLVIGVKLLSYPGHGLFCYRIVHGESVCCVVTESTPDIFAGESIERSDLAQGPGS